MKILLIAALASIMMCACKTGPYIKHELKAEKKGDCIDLLNQEQKTKVTGNINGERYELEYCLPENFETKDFNIIRSGDTLITNLSDITITGKPLVYQLTLDVNAYPAYNYIKIGQQVIHIVPYFK